MKTKTAVLASLLLSSAFAYGHDSAHKAPIHKPIAQPSVNSFTPGPYAKLSVGAAMPTGKASSDYGKKFSTSPVFGIAAGYMFNKNISADLELSHRSGFKFSDTMPVSGKASQKISSTSLMFNGYYGFANHTAFIPYLTAGLGVASHSVGDYMTENVGIDYKTKTSGKRVYSFAWQTGLGVKYRISEQVLFDLGYRYLDLGGFESTPNGSTTLKGKTSTRPAKPYKGNIAAHEISAGVIFKF